MKKFGILLSYIKKEIHIYLIALCATFCVQIITSTMPQILRITVDSILQNGDFDSDIISRIIAPIVAGLTKIESLMAITVVIILLALLKGLLTFARVNLATFATESAIERLKNRFYNHIQLLPFAFHSQNKTGELIQRCTSDMETIRMALYSQIMDIVSSSFLIVYSLYNMFLLNFSLSIIAIISFVITFLAAAFFFSKVQKEFTLAEEYESQMTAAVQENLTGVRVVKAFLLQREQIKKFERLSEQYRNQNLKINTTFATFWGFSDIMFYALIFITVLYGAVLSRAGVITVGTLVAFMSYLALLSGPIRQLARIITNIGKAFVSSSRIEEILSEKAENIYETGEKPAILGNIKFNNVSFSYPDASDIKVLDNISLEINQGETVAILGPTGSGKSSLIQLLIRLYEYNSGSILIDGMELNTIDKAWIRANVGLILQEPFLYAKTIEENIKLSNTKADLKDVRHYSKIVQMDKEIAKFEKGYDTMLGERGVTLSGGQKQRIAIARTLIKDGAVLIFDDSLSAVDTETDSKIRNSIIDEKGKKTIIIISHRISTVVNADRIYVLQNGKISQCGTHNQLKNEDGWYKRIYDLQAAIDNEG